MKLSKEVNMREIKFRSWYPLENRMMSHDEMSDMLDLSYGEMFGEAEMKAIPTMQFTGLKDKNGVEIYEGDIVCNEGFKEKVYWDQFYGWVVSDEAMLGEVNFASIKVIGNIYENPELLEDTP